MSVHAALENARTRSFSSGMPGADAQFIYPQPNQQRRRQGLCGQAPTNPNPSPSAGRIGGHLNQPQHRRVKRVSLFGQGAVAPVHGQGVLGQVVGPNGEEVRLFGQVPGVEGGRGHPRP